jgi:hypothetical protein
MARTAATERRAAAPGRALEVRLQEHQVHRQDRSGGRDADESLWMAAAPNEYGFYANVNPDVDHPRWSQATERRIGEGGRRPTQMFNGYGEQVAALYSGMDLARTIENRSSRKGAKMPRRKGRKARKSLLFAFLPCALAPLRLCVSSYCGGVMTQQIEARTTEHRPRLSREGRRRLLRVAYHAVGLFPLAWLLFDYWFGLLGPEPIRAMILRTGKAAIIMLTLSLAARPPATSSVGKTRRRCGGRWASTPSCTSVSTC